jgi:hypothetical protein
MALTKITTSGDSRVITTYSNTSIGDSEVTVSLINFLVGHGFGDYTGIWEYHPNDDVIYWDIWPTGNPLETAPDAVAAAFFKGISQSVDGDPTMEGITRYERRSHTLLRKPQETN